MQYLSLAHSEGPVYSVLDNALANNVLVGGRGNVAIWQVKRRLDGPTELKRVDFLYTTPSIPAGITQADVGALATDDTETRQQLAFCANGVTVLVVAVGGVVLEVLKQIHTRPITAMHYYTHLRLLVTGASDGTLKVWDQLYQLRHVFVGHTKRITTIVPHP
jgi:WD40 repeat protein